MNESQEAAKNKNEQEQGHQKGEINGGDSIPSPIPSHSIYVIPVICLLFFIILLFTYIQIENLEIDINNK
jgi:hypothetical protein